MDVRFTASVAVITDDPVQSRRLYMDALVLPVAGGRGRDCFHSESIGGSKHLGVGPLTRIAGRRYDLAVWLGNMLLRR